jgi:hypothetical protein
MRAMRLLFICMVLVIQLFTSIIVTLSSEQILRALQTPQTLTGLISGSLSVILMVILMAGLFLPQFDHMSRYIRLVDTARNIVERARSNEPMDPRELDAYREMLKSQEWGVDGTSPTLPTRNGTRRRPIVQAAQPPDEWPYGR